MYGKADFMRKKSIRNIKIHTRLMAAFILLISLPMIFTSIFIYDISKNASEKKVITCSNQLINAAADKLNTELKHLESIVEELSMESDIQNFLINNNNMSYMKTFQIRNSISQKFVEKMRISTLSLSSDITSIDMILDDNSIIGAGQINYKKEQLLNLYKYTRNSDNRFNYRMLMDINGNYQVAISMKIINHITGKYIGAIILTFKESYIKETLDNLNIGDNSEIIVIDQDGIEISTNKVRRFTSNLFEENSSLFSEISNNNGENNLNILINSKRYIAVFQTVKSSNWKIIGLVPVSFIQQDSKLLFSFIVFIGLVSLTFAFIAATKISYSISEPISILKKLMTMATEGNLDVKSNYNGSDEISEISKAFNLMIDSLKNLLTENEDTNKEIIYKLGEVIEVRSKETGNHVYRVANYSKIIGLKLGMNESESETLKLASILHDIGKISIPDEILLKPGKLTEEEFNIMKTHTIVGHEILKDSKKDILILASKIALEHHERYDGQGYPNKLKGDGISIHSKIVTLADVFDALGSKRSYKEAWNLNKTLDYIQEQRGHQFDPYVFDAFIEGMREILEIKEAFTD